MPRKFPLCFLTTALGMFITVGSASAQISPVKVTVTKLQKRDRKVEGKASGEFYNDGGQTPGGPTSGRRYSAGYQTSKSVPDDFRCGIELTGLGLTALPAVKVNWTVIVESEKERKLTKGEHTCSLDPGKSIKFETDPAKGKGVGYLVEVFVDGKLVAISAEPRDVQRTIEQLKPAKPAKPAK